MQAAATATNHAAEMPAVAAPSIATNSCGADPQLQAAAVVELAQPLTATSVAEIQPPATALASEVLQVQTASYNVWSAWHKQAGTKRERRKLRQLGEASIAAQCPWPQGNASCDKCIRFFPEGWFAKAIARQGTAYIASEPLGPCAVQLESSDSFAGPCSEPQSHALAPAVLVEDDRALAGSGTFVNSDILVAYQPEHCVVPYSASQTDDAIVLSGDAMPAAKKQKVTADKVPQRADKSPAFHSCSVGRVTMRRRKVDDRPTWVMTCVYYVRVESAW